MGPADMRTLLDLKAQVMAEIDLIKEAFHRRRISPRDFQDRTDDLNSRIRDLDKAMYELNQRAMNSHMSAQQHFQLAQAMLQQQQYQQQSMQGLANQYQPPPPIFRHNPLPPEKPKPLAEVDQFGEIIGYRCWRCPVRPILTSVHVQKHLWMPGEIEECDVGETIADSDQHGFHAWRDKRQAASYAVECGPPIVVGSVKLWGTVICHERGYRGQYAKIASLDFITVHSSDSLSEVRALRVLRQHYQLA